MAVSLQLDQFFAGRVFTSYKLQCIEPWWQRLKISPTQAIISILNNKRLRSDDRTTIVYELQFYDTCLC